MKNIVREDYTLSDNSITVNDQEIMLEDIQTAKVYDGSGDCMITYKNGKKVKFDFEGDDDRVFVDMLNSITGGKITSRKRNVFEAIKTWVYYLFICFILLGVLYWLQVDGGRVRVPAVMIPILYFIMDFGLIKTGVIAVGIFGIGSSYSIINRKTITEYTKV